MGEQVRRNSHASALGAPRRGTHSPRLRAPLLARRCRCWHAAPLLGRQAAKLPHRQTCWYPHRHAPALAGAHRLVSWLAGAPWVGAFLPPLLMGSPSSPISASGASGGLGMLLRVAPSSPGSSLSFCGSAKRDWWVEVGLGGWGVSAGQVGDVAERARAGDRV